MNERQLAQDDKEDEFIFPVDDNVDLEEDLESENEEDPGQLPEEPKPFKLSKGDDPGPVGDTAQPGMDDKDLVRIVHLGQVHMVTKEKAIELAQKGFDYDVKVGPDSRLVKAVRSSPEIARDVDAAIRKHLDPNYRQQIPQGQVNGQQIPKPFDGMDDNEPITAAEARAELIKMTQAMQQQRQPENRQPRPAGPTPIQMMLQGRDPVTFHQVSPRLQEFAQKLSVEDYRRIDSDPAAMCQFYDYVKSNVVGQLPGQRQVTPQNTGSFRARSAGGNPSRTKTDEQKIWEMPNADFERELARFKSGG